MTQVIFEWYAPTLDGPVPAAGVVRIQWLRRGDYAGGVRVTGADYFKLTGRREVELPAGDFLRITYSPQGVRSWTRTVLVPQDGPVLAQLMPDVDPVTLDQTPAPAVWDVALREERAAREELAAEVSRLAAAPPASGPTIVPGLVLDTDGVPAFIPGAPAEGLTITADTDGVPAVISTREA